MNLRTTIPQSIALTITPQGHPPLTSDSDWFVDKDERKISLKFFAYNLKMNIFFIHTDTYLDMTTTTLDSGLEMEVYVNFMVGDVHAVCCDKQPFKFFFSHYWNLFYFIGCFSKIRKIYTSQETLEILGV